MKDIEKSMIYRSRKPGTCEECIFNPECKRPDKIHNAYGGLECSKIWSGYRRFKANYTPHMMDIFILGDK